MYRIINSDNLILSEKDQLTDILLDWIDYRRNIQDLADITEINFSKIKVDWYYPDNITEIIQIVKD